MPILTGFKVNSSSNASENYANTKKDGHHTHGGRQCQLRGEGRVKEVPTDLQNLRKRLYTQGFCQLLWRQIARH
jgi:hypothetical protein